MYKVQKKDIKRASQVLAGAFVDYPVFKYVLPDRDYRIKKLEYLFSFLIKIGLLEGEVIATSNKLEGISIWIDSASKRTSISKIIIIGLLPLIGKLDLMSIKRFINIGLKKQKIRKSILNFHYCLLDVIGTDPTMQGKGYAKQILESKLREYDNLKIPVYLETSNIDNLTYYEKYSFQLFHEYELNAMKVYCMLRNK